MGSKIKRLLRQIKGLFPSRMPLGMTEFGAWSDDIRNTYELPTTDVDSINFTFATMILHLGPQADYKPKYFFVKSLRASAAKQIAGAVFQDIKQRQATRVAAENETNKTAS